MSYEKNNWTTGDVVTAEKLNHMENGIAGAGWPADLPKPSIGGYGYEDFGQPFYNDPVTPYHPTEMPFDFNLAELGEIEWPEEPPECLKVVIDDNEYVLPLQIVIDGADQVYYYGDIDAETMLPKFDRYPVCIEGGSPQLATIMPVSEQFTLQISAGVAHTIDPKYIDGGGGNNAIIFTAFLDEAYAVLENGKTAGDVGEAFESNVGRVFIAVNNVLCLVMANPATYDGRFAISPSFVLYSNADKYTGDFNIIGF